MILKMETKIPKERIGAIIGKSGKIKELLERECRITLKVDSENGNIVVIANEETDVVGVTKVLQVVQAIGRGFSYEKAKILFDNDYSLDVIDLTDYAGKSESNLKRIKGRIIGAEGKARKIIEELTGTYVSVYGHTVSIIGQIDDIKAAHEAIEILANGSQHKTVYERLQKRRTRLKLEKLQLWKRREDL